VTQRSFARRIIVKRAQRIVLQAQLARVFVIQFLKVEVFSA
jgi:hypothetical protein